MVREQQGAEYTTAEEANIVTRLALTTLNHGGTFDLTRSPRVCVISHQQYASNMSH
jgi:hypothetical protein